MGCPGSRRDRSQESHTCDAGRSEEHTSELQSQSNLVCRLLLEKKTAEHGLVFDIEGLFRVVRQFVRPMRAEAQAILVIKDAPVPLETLLFPVIKPLLHLAWIHE